MALFAWIKSASSAEATILVAALAPASSVSCRLLGDNRGLPAETMAFGLHGGCGLLKDDTRAPDCRCKSLEVFPGLVPWSLIVTANGLGGTVHMNYADVFSFKKRFQAVRNGFNQIAAARQKHMRGPRLGSHLLDFFANAKVKPVRDGIHLDTVFFVAKLKCGRGAIDEGLKRVCQALVKAHLAFLALKKRMPGP